MDPPREPLPSLPDNAEALRALMLAALAERDAVASERDAAVSERDALLVQNDRLRHLLLKLTRMHFGARSERLPGHRQVNGALPGRVRSRSRVG